MVGEMFAALLQLIYILGQQRYIRWQLLLPSLTWELHEQYKYDMQVWMLRDRLSLRESVVRTYFHGPKGDNASKTRSLHLTRCIFL